MGASLTLDLFYALLSGVIAERSSVRTMLESFQLFDVDNKGFVSIKDIRRVAIEAGVVLTEDEIALIVTAVDKDSDGEIDFDEWLKLIGHDSQ
jgi:Ca2+-binding EF-hand superfamily protein